MESPCTFYIDLVFSCLASTFRNQRAISEIKKKSTSLNMVVLFLVIQSSYTKQYVLYMFQYRRLNIHLESATMRILSKIKFSILNLSQLALKISYYL